MAYGKNVASEAVFQAYNELHYSQMPDDYKYLRLLTILSAKEDEPVFCTLRTYLKEAAPPYIALSYVWGDSSSDTSIIVNEQRLTVRGNCDHALRQAACHDISQYYWIDAVCINQNDKVEKGHQVAKMGPVYKAAEYVIACLGPAKDNSDIVFDIIEKYSALLERVGRDTEWIPGQLTRAVSFPGFWKWYFGVRSRALKKLGNAMYFHLCHELPQRAWICQEAATANPLIICQGTRSCPCTTYAGFAYALQYEYQLSRWSHSQQATLRDRVLRLITILRRRTVASEEEAWYAQMRAWAPSLGIAIKSTLPTLSDLLHVMRRYLCADPRDRIYSALFLTRWGEGETLEPDYYIWQFDLAVQVIQRLSAARPGCSLQDAIALADMLELRPPTSVSGLAMSEFPGWRDVDDILPDDDKPTSTVQIRATGIRLSPAIPSQRTLEGITLSPVAEHDFGDSMELSEAAYKLEVDGLPGITLMSRASPDGSYEVFSSTVGTYLDGTSETREYFTISFEPQDLFRLIIASNHLGTAASVEAKVIAASCWDNVKLLGKGTFATQEDLKLMQTNVSGWTLYGSPTEMSRRTTQVDNRSGLTKASTLNCEKNDSVT